MGTSTAPTPLRATLVYADPKGTVGSTVHRINDLTLKVTAPDGTVYWGNNGLMTANWSVSSLTGTGADLINTVENVFVQNPQPGDWAVTVIAAEINQDGHTETPEVDVDFALVVSGVQGSAGAWGGDWNRDGKVEAADVFAFLTDFAAGRGNVDGDGGTAAADAFLFFNEYFARPPER